MEIITKYREWFEYERDCNNKMLSMLESVPGANRQDERFQRAVTLADHLVACREKWLDIMLGGDGGETSWRNENCEISTLRPRYSKMETTWTQYLSSMEETHLAEQFKFFEFDGEQYSLAREIQIAQLMGHALYHRGQIALLVDQLGGAVEDTDYVDWWWYNMRASTDT